MPRKKNTRAAQGAGNIRKKTVTRGEKEYKMCIRDSDPLLPEGGDGPVGAGGAADVHQGIHRQVFHSSSSMVTWSPFRRA